MYHQQEVKAFLVHVMLLMTLWPEYCDSLIITSVLAGDKKFKTISFDHKFLKPLTFEKEMPLTEFRRHRTLRQPKFDIDINIPIKLPLEEEYGYEEPSKPVESDFFFQTKEIIEPSYKKKNAYGGPKPKYQQEPGYAASSVVQQKLVAPEGRLRGPISDPIAHPIANNGLKAVPRSDNMQPIIARNARSDTNDFQEPRQDMVPQETAFADNSISRNSKPNYYGNNYPQQEFIPGGFVNLQLSGPTGGPKMTYQDYDREEWARKLSQTPGAMPYPILNYQQLQNFYGGLGTFTNGLAENRYMEHGLLDKIKSVLSKFHHFG